MSTKIIKHELNVTSANAKVLVGDVTMSIDSILIKMARINFQRAKSHAFLFMSWKNR